MHFERSVDETGEVPLGVDLIGFDVLVNRLLRKRKAEKDYFYPQHEFLHAWLTHYGECSEAEADRLIDGLKARERAEAQTRYEKMRLAIQAEPLHSPDTNFDRNNNVVSLDAYRKK